MNRKTSVFTFVIVLALLTSVSGVIAQELGPQSTQSALGTAFSYQGQLKNVSGPINNNCDFQFSVWNALGGGTLLGNDLTHTNVTVSNGLFTVQLDFGMNVFTGDARWVEIAVRCPAGSGIYATLSPRQPLTPAPYALFSTSTGALQDRPITTTVPTSGQVLKWNGNVWSPADDAIGTPGSGDISGVYAGNGLTGGGASGEVTLSVAFGGNGSASTVARSDHDHTGVYALVAHAHSGADITSGTLGTNYYSAYADLSAEGYLSNAANDLALNNGTLQTSLNADRLDGYHATNFALAAHNHWGESWSGSGTGLTLSGGTTGISGTGSSIGVFGSGSNYGVYGSGSTGVSGNGSSTGVYGSGNSYGIYGYSSNTGVSGSGITGVNGTGSSTGVSGSGNTGVNGTGSSTGVYGSGNSYGVSGYSSSIGVSGSGITGVNGTGSSTGVSGSGNTGVNGTGSSTGVYGSGNSYGVSGYSSSNYGVYGMSGGFAGVYGSASTYGVFGSGSTGVSGIGSTYGISGTGGNTGIWGKGSYMGVYGFADCPNPECVADYGVYGKGDTYGVFGTGIYGVYGSGTTYGGYFDGNVRINGSLTATGSKSAVVETQDYGTRALYAVESPENWFEDFGTGQLTNGKALITIDPVFAETVNLASDYHVFLTPLGDCALYVKEKSPTSFSVRAIGGQTCSIAFDYRIVAKRLGYEDVRLAEVDTPPAVEPPSGETQ